MINTSPNLFIAFHCKHFFFLFPISNTFAPYCLPRKAIRQQMHHNHSIILCMWFQLGRFILKYRLFLLIFLFAVTGMMAYYASKVQLSYEFSKAIPTDDIKYIENQQFIKQFGQSGNTLVLGFQTPHFYEVRTFNAMGNLHQQIRAVLGVEGVLSVPEAINLVKNDSLQTLQARRIFHYPYSQQNVLDSNRMQFENLPFYQQQSAHAINKPD